MDKFSKIKVFSVALMATASAGLISCGGDDDEGGSANGSDTAGIITTSDGENKLLTSVGDVKFEYDENNKLVGVTDSWDKYEVSYNPFKITKTYNYNSSDYTTQEVVSDISVNGKGAITSLKAEYIYEDDDLKEVTTTTMSFSYDGAGHLTSISGSSTEVDTEGDEKETYKASGTYTLTWSNNKLVKISENTSESDGYKYVETTEFEYGDDEYQNLSHQFADNMLAETELFGDYEWFAYLGYYGNGGNYLPTSAYIESESNDDDDYHSTNSESFNYKYSFNSDGTLSSESYKYNSSKNWITRKYTYNSMETRSMSTAVGSGKEVPQKARRGLSHLFFHKRR